MAGGGYGFWSPTSNEKAHQAHLEAFTRRGRRSHWLRAAVDWLRAAVRRR